MIVLFSALILAAQGAATAVPAAGKVDPAMIGITFHGGDFDGLVTAVRVSPGGQHYVGFLPSKSNQSPLPKELGRTVSGLLEAFSNKRPDLYGKYVHSDAQSYVGCSYICDIHNSFVENGFPFEEKLTVNTPYYMGEDRLGPLVRLEWLHNGDLWYLSFLHFRDGKVSKVNSIRAAVPNITRAN